MPSFNFQNNPTGGAKNTPLYRVRPVDRESVQRPGRTVFVRGVPTYQPIEERSAPMSAIARLKQGLKRQ